MFYKFIWHHFSLVDNNAYLLHIYCTEVSVCVYIIILCAFVTELCVHYYCVPIAVYRYHHEPSRQKFKINYKVDDYNHTELQHVPMHVCMCHHRVYYSLRSYYFITNTCTAYRILSNFNIIYHLKNKFHDTERCY